jgi:hypothetical protein
MTDPNSRKYFAFRISNPEVRKMLVRLSSQDDRSGVAEITSLIRQEYARRFSTPQPVITVADAQNTAQAVI